MVVGLEGVAEGQQNHQVEQMPLAFDQGIGAEVAAHGQADIAAHHIPSAEGEHQQQGPAGQPGRQPVEGIDAISPAQPAPHGAPLASPKAKRA